MCRLCALVDKSLVFQAKASNRKGVQAKFERVEPGPGSSLRILEIAQVKFDASWHFHPEWELTWIREGSGRRFVGDCIEFFGAGDLVLVGPGVPHFWFSDAAAEGGISRALVVQFPGDFPGEAFLALPEMGEVARVLKRGARGLFFSGRGVDEARQRLAKLMNLGAFEAVLELLGVLQLLAATRSRSLAGPSYERLSGESSPHADRAPLRVSHGAFQRTSHAWAYCVSGGNEPVGVQSVFHEGDGRRCLGFSHAAARGPLCFAAARV